MAKNKAMFDFASVVADIKDSVSAVPEGSGYGHMPDIIEFCESKLYLNLPGRGINLFPMQRIILKCLYRGQPGNEHLALTEEEIEHLKQLNLHYVLEKYYSSYNFRELVLVLGRRGGKDFLTSLIALYEAMKLLEIPGGCPYKYYGIDTSVPIYILTIATAAEQAHILFDEIKGKLEYSVYFQSKLTSKSIESDKIYLLTPADKEHNKKIANGELPTSVSSKKGSVIIMSGHSNSASLLGKGCFSLLLDEVASFNTAGIMSGERVYSAMGPSMIAFSTVVGHDEHGAEIRELDAKIISISSPRAEEGIFYKLWADTENVPRRLAFKLPSWKVNLSVTEAMLREEFKYMNPNEFDMEFGAQFSGTAGEKFIADKYVDQAIEMGVEINLEQRIQGRPGFFYYAHLDPASTSHNYALVVLHVEDRIRARETESGFHKKERYKLFVVDHIMVWQPSPGKAVNIFEVDQYVADLARRFRFAMVTYDTWNSIASIQKLRAKGIPTKMTPFRKQYKMAIYDRLEHVLVNNQLALQCKGPWAKMIEMELKCLKRIYRPTGYQIKPDPEAQITTDDTCDAVAGAVGQATEVIYNGYPRGAMAFMPQSRDGGGHMWNVGRGQYQHNQWQALSKKFGW